jgi:hypothetical protein
MRLICIVAALLLTAFLPACAQASLDPSGAGLTTVATNFPPKATLFPTQLPAATQAPTDKPAVEATPTAAQATQPPASSSGEITVDLSGVAQDKTIATVAAVAGTSDSSYWMAAPEYRLVTLTGYPVAEHTFKPQIFIYPVDALKSANPAAAQIIADLQTLLSSPKEAEEMPFLPLINAKQVMHAKVQSRDFQNGTGVRFLTQIAQGPIRINNVDLIYTFQGLTSDGKYYIAAILPVTHPDLPAAQQLFSENADEMKNYPPYVTQTATWLDQQPSGSFTPDLARLDAMLASLKVL